MIAFYLILGMFVFILLMAWNQARRAFSTKPIDYIYGMALDIPKNELVHFRTPIYLDRKSGIKYYGIPEKICDDENNS